MKATMAETYRFKVGNFSCLAVSDGSYDYPPAALFANAAAETVTQELNRIGVTAPLVTTPYTFLLVETGRQRVLVDLGAGPLAPTTGKLAANLAAAGYRPEEIDFFMPTPGAGQMIVQSNDVFVDKSRGLVFLIDRLNGLDILELTG